MIGCFKLNQRLRFFPCNLKISDQLIISIKLLSVNMLFTDILNQYYNCLQTLLRWEIMKRFFYED